MHWREQGDRGEWAAMAYFAARGAAVFAPVGHSPDVDFIAYEDGRLLRVQVKTTGCFRNNRWELTTCTRGGNQSWNGLVKKLDARHFDLLAGIVADGRRWLIPSSEVDGHRMVRLGGPKYAEFEISSAPEFGWTPQKQVALH